MKQNADVFTDVTSWGTDHAAETFVAVTSVLIAIELGSHVAAGRFTRHTARSAVTSITSGLTFLVVKSIVAWVAMTSFALWIYDNHRVATLDLDSPWVWVGVLVLRDLVYYWVHRAEHRAPVLWAAHMVHHSPQTIGYTSAIRIPWMEALYKPLCYIWLPLIGFDPLAAIAIDAAAATQAQLYHTERWRRIPLLDRIFVTPSAHRVHHGSNHEYRDKNFGAVFIIWDKLFGTFEPERAKVVYGIGDRTVDTPRDALVGGYPALVDEVRAEASWAARARCALGVSV